MLKIENRKKINFYNYKRYFTALFLISIIFIFYFNFNIKDKNISFINDYIEKFSLQYGYVLKDIEINNLSYLKEDKIRDSLSQYYNKSIFLIPIKTIASHLLNNSWIKSISIHSQFPSLLKIDIIEHIPSAILEQNNEYFIISEEGIIIEDILKNNFNNLLLIRGTDRNNEIKIFLNAVKNINSVKIAKADYINDRRWNIYTFQNILVKLPELNLINAMQIFDENYDKIISFGEKNINFIDLRITKKIIINFNNREELIL